MNEIRRKRAQHGAGSQLFFPDGIGNHGIDGIQSTPSKTGLIDSSLFGLKKGLAWAKFGG